MASIQRIFPRLNTAADSYVRHPVGAVGLWDQVSAVYSAAGARYAGPDQGSIQVQAVPAFAAISGGTTKTILIAQVLTDPLRQVFIPAGNWNLGFAASLANASGTFAWQGVAALFVLDGQTGARRATIWETTAIGSSGRTATAERTCYASIAGQGVQVRTSDVLCLEIGLSITNSGASTVPIASLFADGTGPITADNIAASSAMSVLEAPQALLLSLPQAGEQPTASVNHAQAVSIVKEAWPPHTDLLYDWDNPEATIKRFFDAMGDIAKLYIFFFFYRVFRELNPLTTVELLPAWEAALGISLSDAVRQSRTIDQRRNQVLSRLREAGPLTLFNLAAIFGRLANYAPGTTPEVLELDHATQRSANQYSDLVNDTIPVGTGFDNTNLIRTTPTLLDGGVVWDTGALVAIHFTPLSVGTQGVHVQLTGPDFRVAQWTLGPNLDTTLYLRSPVFADGPIHGNWILNIYKESGVGAIVLLDWKLYVLGKLFGGRAQSKFTWAVFLDSLHQMVDRRDLDGTLNRITQSYAQGFVIYSKTSLPGVNTTRAGRFIPGT